MKFGPLQAPPHEKSHPKVAFQEGSKNYFLGAIASLAAPAALSAAALAASVAAPAAAVAALVAAEAASVAAAAAEPAAADAAPAAAPAAADAASLAASTTAAAGAGAAAGASSFLPQAARATAATMAASARDFFIFNSFRWGGKQFPEIVVKPPKWRLQTKRKDSSSFNLASNYMLKPYLP